MKRQVFDLDKVRTEPLVNDQNSEAPEPIVQQISVPVGVSYSSSPESMTSLEESVAHEHPHILPHPKPTGLFVGFGDSSLNFELRAWTGQFDDWPIVRSQLASSVYDAVHKAGMKFPFPQREVRLLHDLSGDDVAIS